MTDKVFLQGIKIIETICEKEFSEKKAGLYRDLLNEIPDEKFIVGITEMLKRRVFSNLPMPAEIIQYCQGLKEDDLEIRIAEAKNKLEKAIGSIGTYRTVAFDDPDIHLVINAYGGWIKLGMTNIDDFKNWLKFEFPKLYKSFASRKNQFIPMFLEGKGEDKTIIYIGDKEKALKWTSAYTRHIEKKENQAINTLVNKMAI